MHEEEGAMCQMEHRVACSCYMHGKEVGCDVSEQYTMAYFTIVSQCS
jgi:hypothetical protein